MLVSEEFAKVLGEEDEYEEEGTEEGGDRGEDLIH
jgi:hypothetical protein